MKQYQQMIQTALLGVVKDILQQVAQNGLTDESYFYITFDTTSSGVIIPDFLKQKYPQEMTIVLQHQFDELTIQDDLFSVILSFNGKPERLTIPFRAILSFADPSEQFALQFMPALMDEHKAQPPQKNSAEIIDLEAMRKKQ